MSSTLRTSAMLLLLSLIACLWATTAVAQPRPPTFVGDTLPNSQAPEVFHMTMVTNVMANTGKHAPPVVIEVTRAWAPIGADRFWQLCTMTAPASNPGAKPLRNGTTFYTDGAFFRVVPNFVVQFGINGVPALNRPWDINIKDDPVRKSNVRGTFTYATAGPNTRTTQVFINLGDNSRLDKMGFAPIGRVVSGMQTVDAIYNPTPGNSGGISSANLTAMGNKWLLQKYPATNLVVRSWVANGAASSSMKLPTTPTVDQTTVSSGGGGNGGVVKIRVGHVDDGSRGGHHNEVYDSLPDRIYPRHPGRPLVPTGSRRHHRTAAQRRHSWAVFIACLVVAVVIGVSAAILVRQRYQQRCAAAQHIQQLQNQNANANNSGLSSNAQVILAPLPVQPQQQQLQQPLAQQLPPQIQYPPLPVGGGAPHHI